MWALQPEVALRAGFSGHAGVLGVAVELRPMPGLGFALGSGTHALSGGFSLGGRPWHGLYVDGHVVWIRANPIFERQGGSGLGVGATIGWEYRPVKMLSVKVGAGGAWNTATGRPGLVIDLMAGPVLSW